MGMLVASAATCVVSLESGGLHPLAGIGAIPSDLEMAHQWLNILDVKKDVRQSVNIEQHGQLTLCSSVSACSTMSWA